MRSFKLNKTESQDLSAEPLSYTTDYACDFTLTEILIHFSVAVTETITITLDSVKGVNYDTVLRSRRLSGEQDFVYRPEGNADYYKGDNIKIECTNANGVGIAYVTVKAKEKG